MRYLKLAYYTFMVLLLIAFLALLIVPTLAIGNGYPH